MNQTQVTDLLLKLLAAGGPIGALLLQYGFPDAKVTAWLQIAGILIPLGVSIYFGNRHTTDEAIATKASNIPGVEVHVDTTPSSPAPLEVRELTASDAAPNVKPA